MEIQPFEIDDLVLGKKVAIRQPASDGYGAILEIGERWYYFNKDGTLDGTSCQMTPDATVTGDEIHTDGWLRLDKEPENISYTR
jgi:hypothetical protein